jgi:hypothetical protein
MTTQKFLEAFWSHHKAGRRKRFVAQALPIVEAFVTEYGMPVPPDMVKPHKVVNPWRLEK